MMPMAGRYLRPAGENVGVESTGTIRMYIPRVLTVGKYTPSSIKRPYDSIRLLYYHMNHRVACPVELPVEH